MKRVSIGLLTVITMLSLVPTVDCEVLVNGYFEPQFSGTALDDDFLQLNSNKLRIDLSSSISDNVTFTGNFNYVAYNGQTTWNLLDFLPEKLAGEVPAGSVPLYSLRYEDEGKLDNAYLRLYSEVFTLTLGRQQMSVGSGYAWNPTDLFNVKDLLDPTYEQPGVSGLRFDIGLSEEHTVVAFYSPEEKWETSGKLIRVLWRISHFDCALSAGQQSRAFRDFATFETRERRTDMLGFDFNGEILGIGCWSENAYACVEDEAHYWENIIGLDYTFSSGWYVTGEYYHNGQGKTDSQQYSLDDWMRYLTVETKTLARDQLYSYTYYPLTDLLTVGGSLVYSASDNSLLLIPTGAYSVSDNLTLTVFGSVYTGEEGTMYSRDMGSGGIIRLRAYF